jgi:hypothetical protein
MEIKIHATIHGPTNGNGTNGTNDAIWRSINVTRYERTANAKKIPTSCSTTTNDVRRTTIPRTINVPTIQTTTKQKTTIPIIIPRRTKTTIPKSTRRSKKFPK